MLTEFYIATLLSRQSDVDKRLRSLAEARDGLRAFRETCVRVGVIPRNQRGAIAPDADNDTEALTSQALARRIGGGSGAGASDSASMRAAALARGSSSREAKIERYKLNAAAKKRLAELRKMTAAMARMQVGGADGAASAAAADVDDTARREVAILELQVRCN